MEVFRVEVFYYGGCNCTSKFVLNPKLTVADSSIVFISVYLCL